jgi:hypothetical protein
VYVRNGTVSLFLAFEPLAGWQHAAVSDSRKRGDWARLVKALVEGRYRHAKRIVLVMDQLNTHSPASLDEADLAPLLPSLIRRVCSGSGSS